MIEVDRMRCGGLEDLPQALHEFGVGRVIRPQCKNSAVGEMSGYRQQNTIVGLDYGGQGIDHFE